jgi:tetratricopeptide (TPR) repeat protein
MPIVTMICISVFSLFTIFILFRLLSTSEYPDSKKYFKFFFGSVVLILGIVAYYGVFYHPAKVRPRLAIFPLIDFSFNDEKSWLGWAISDHAGQCIQNTCKNSFQIVPPEWVWEAMDPDSAVDPDYLVQYAHRIHLDYVLIGGLFADCLACPVEWQFIDVKKDSAVIIKKTDLDTLNEISTGAVLAHDVCSFLNNGPFMPVPTPEKSIAQYTILIKHALAIRHFDQALSLAEKALIEDSTDVLVRSLYARSQLEVGIGQNSRGHSGDFHLAMARQSALNTLKTDSSNSEIYRIIGKVHVMNKFWDKAEKALTRALSCDPDNFRVYLDLTSLHSSRIKKLGFSNEEQLYRTAIGINPCFVEGRLRLAEYFYFNNLPVRSRQVIDELLDIDPRSMDGLLFLGKIAMAANDTTQIRAVYKKLLNMDPQNPIAFYNLGVYFFNSGDMEHAEESFNNAVRYGNYADAHLYLGQIYEKKGLIQQAIAEYRLRIRLKNGNEDPYLTKARTRLYQLTHPDSVSTDRDK